MYLADYHTHTQFSPDAHDPMTVMAQAALDAGMDEICFTDHVEPLTWGSNELRPPYDWSGLTADFAKVQAALGDRIHLRLGMEMGDAQKAPAHMKKLLEDAPQFDFVIGSVHLLSEHFGSEDLYLYTPKDQTEAQIALGDYLEEVLALAKLGGFDIAGLCGVFLGGALEGVPVLMDGFISGVAALCAVRLCPAAEKAVFASHCSTEPAAKLVLEALDKKPLLTAGLHLGEGTGAVASIPLWDMALEVYNNCYSFTEGGITPYTPQC